MEALQKKMIKKEFTLEGLDCANCALKIEKGVKDISGVRSSTVNFATRTLSVEVDEQQLERVITDTKATVKKLEPHVQAKEKGEQVHHGHEHNHDHSGLNQKIVIRLCIGAILTAIGMFAPLSGIYQLGIFLIAYLIVGGDIVLRAVKNIIRGQVFDEHFLMAIATIGAFAVKQYPEGVAVMLFYQVGELFQGLAVNRSRKSISALMNIRPDYANVKTGSILLTILLNPFHYFNQPYPTNCAF